MPETNGENVAARQSSKSPKDKWDIIQVVAAAIGAVLIPIVIGFGSCSIQQSISKESVAKDYVGIAISILERPKDEEHSALRDWAVDLLNLESESTLKFTPRQLAELRSGGLALLAPDELFSAESVSPDGKEVARMRTAEHYRQIAEVYDSLTERLILQFPVSGSGPFGSPTLVWSHDGSKLLAGWSRHGFIHVDLYNVAQRRSLGARQFGHGSRKLEELHFSEDDRSVIMTSDGESPEVWNYLSNE